MYHKFFKLLILLLISKSALAGFYDWKNTKGSNLIYGEDQRYEVEDYYDRKFIDFSSSVALRVSNKRLSNDLENENQVNFNTKTLQELMPQICPNERFVNQKSLGDCSGFLVAPNKIVTAGHCMNSTSDCTKNSWVFGYALGKKNFDKNDVYTCKKIISKKYTYGKYDVSDFAVIELDREVRNRTPLEYRKSGFLTFNSQLLVIGHPMGLPMKITDGGRVSKMNIKEKEHLLNSIWLKTHYFTTNLDVYAGNSGSPVFNKKTGKVEGIIIQGAEDFIFDEKAQCMKSQRLSDDSSNVFEKVMRITKIEGL